MTQSNNRQSMKIFFIALALVLILAGVLLVYVLGQFASAVTEAHGKALYTGVGAWTRVAEFARASGKPHYIAEADKNLAMLLHDLAQWRQTAPKSTDFAALEKLQAEAYATTDRNIKAGENPLAHLDLPNESATTKPTTQ
jgi:hypothetical protein